MSQQNKRTPLPPPSGQAMVEYTLIVVLVIFGFALALAATGPTIANVFSNTVFNLVSRENDKIPVNAQGTRISPPGVSDFWQTVTAVAMIVPVEKPLPTSTVANPTFTPTPGPPPPPTNTLTPSPTVPTSTPTATYTPTDLAVKAPWTDTANEKVFWRLDEIDPMGPEDWYGTYYTGLNLDGTVFLEGYNGILDPSKKQIIEYDWQDKSPSLSGPVDNFSVSWVRNISLSKNMQLTFSVPRVDDGIRIWISGGDYGSALPACSTKYKGTGVWVTNSDAALGYNSATDPLGATIPKDCLIVENWNGNSSFGPGAFTRTIKAGNYKLHVDYQEKGSKAYASVGISNNTNLANPDDALIDGAGNPITYVDPADNKTKNAAANCDWGNPTGLEKFADTPDKTWTGYKTGNDAPNFVGQRRCFLEFRGSIEIPDVATMPNPTLTFWDLWDFPAATTAWVEVAIYNPDRTLLTWERFPLHASDSFNYNWTYQTIPLDTAKYSGKKIALRFGLENRSASAKSRWWVDTIAIDNVVRTELYMAKTWRLDTKEEAKDFIASGNWGLTTENMIGGSGFAWHESPGANYNDMNYERPSLPPTNIDNYRIHSLEFNGIIDLADPRGAKDQDTDTGDPELTFYHTYDLANYTGLEIQYVPVTDVTKAYTAGAPATWTTFTGSTLVPRTGTGNASLVVAEQRRISLKPIADAGVTKFRLRFAMLVDKDSANNKSGWWIDDIRLERVDKPRFSPFPFEDDVETDASDAAWLKLGPWAREEGGYAPKTGEGWSWTDSPGANYQDNDTTVLELRYPMDLRADTLTNPRSPKCNLGPTICNTNPLDQDKAAIKPVMTFWWKHDLGAADNFFLEWKLKSETGWRTEPLWYYKDGMVTVGNGNNQRTRVSKAWERAEVDMTPVMTAIGVDAPGTDNEDDIVFRFRFQTSASGNGPGIWLDQIEVRENVEQVWRLWPTGEVRTDNANVPLTNGNGVQYVNSGEDLDMVPPQWFVGGDWQPIDWEIHDGLNAFHDSVLLANGSDQSVAETGSGDTLATTRRDTFNVLELNTIFDLRGTFATERPLVYFWHRYSVPSNSTISMQVAVEKTAASTATCRDGFKQCYEKLYGWEDWTTIWSVTGEKTNLAWTREQVNLSSYAKNGATAGKRIRIRFVMDALDAGNDRDGWYLDQFSVMHYPQRLIPITASDSFVDYSTDMTNWIDEGKWGLDPEVFKGGGGIPISLGDFWTVNYWSFSGNTVCKTLLGSDVTNNTQFRNCVNSFFTPSGNDVKRAKSTTYLPNTTGIAPTIPNRTEIEIFHEWGNSGPSNAGTTYSDQFAGRWELVTNIVGSPGAPKGKITFIMASDEGARLKYMNQNNDGTVTKTSACMGMTSTCGFSTANPTGIDNWNIIDHFTPHGRSVTVGSAFLAAAGAAGNNNTTGKYRFILEYYDYSGSAVLTLATGTDTFSFSDTPKQGAGSGFTDIPAIRKSSSSLILNGVLDLTNAVKPYISYSTLYELGGNARVEVSDDGGFTWTSNGLVGDVENKWADPSWTVEMWNNNSLSYTPTGSTAANYPAFNVPTLDFNWGTGNAFNSKADNFSLRFTRKINLLTSDELQLRTEADDGVRLWIYKVSPAPADLTPQSMPNGCPTSSPLGYMRSGQPMSNGGQASYTTGCLLIDNWKSQGPTGTETTFKPPSSGVYMIQVDYFEVGSGAQISLDVTPSGFDLPVYSGTRMDTANWQIKMHDLSDYQGKRINLRFRLDRLGTNTIDSTTGNGYLNSWWLTEIGVFSN